MVGSSRAEQPGNDSILHITDQAPAEAAGSWRVSFRDQGAKPSYVERMGVASVDGVAKVDCVARRFQLERMVLHADPRGGPASRGSEEPLMRIGPRPEWRAADAGSLLARVIAATCRPSPRITEARQKVLHPPTTAPAVERLPAEGATKVQVQFGAFSTREQALKTWSLISRDGDLTALKPMVESATVGGKLYHRLLVEGFASRDAARDLCKRASVKGYACFLRG
ncbi:hypothetical protein BH10PSE4_BH10PSE4_42210 [soil metagenome]